MSDVRVQDLLNEQRTAIKSEISSMQKKFRDSFTGVALDTAKWAVQAQGAGTALTVGSGILTLGSGTTAAAECSILSKETFTVPFKLSYQLTLSQRIANQTFSVEVVSVDPTTGVPDGLHVAGWIYDGTSATQAKYRVGNGGAAPLDSAASTIVTTAGTGVYELEPFGDECWFHSGTLDSTSGRANSYRRHQQIPDPNALYKIRVKWRNGGTSPASNTNATLQFVACQDYAEITAEITAGRGQVVAGQAVGVAVVSVPTTTIAGAAAHDAAVSGNPTRIAGRALTANYTAVASGDTADIITTTVGAQITKPYALPETDWQYGNITPITTAVTTALKAAGAAGIRNYVTGLQFINTSATGTIVSLQDGTTVIWAGYAPQNVPVDIPFLTPLRGTAATAMNFVTATAGCSVVVSAQGYQAP